ncbi:MAG: chemotaxis protein CheW [Verrucomicrobiota bacterium]|jgi:purine-binding chemotaxis protein CheW
MTTTSETSSSSLLAKPGKYLTFLLGHESYGLPVLKVREIIRLVEITPVPHMPPYVKGVINLRGKLVPVMDLRIRFDLSAREFTESTCVVVAQVKSDSGGIIHMGFIVDGVEEVITFTQDDIENTPDFGTKINTDYLLGMANVKNKVVALLDIDLVVEKSSLEKTSEAAAP